MKLEFENSEGIRRIIGYPDSLKETHKMINDFLAQYPHFKHYYTRINMGEKEWWFDVGSHTEGMVLSDLNDNILDELKE